MLRVNTFNFIKDCFWSFNWSLSVWSMAGNVTFSFWPPHPCFARLLLVLSSPLPPSTLGRLHLKTLLLLSALTFVHVKLAFLTQQNWTFWKPSLRPMNLKTVALPFSTNMENTNYEANLFWDILNCSIWNRCLCPCGDLPRSVLTHCYASLHFTAANYRWV